MKKICLIIMLLILTCSNVFMQNSVDYISKAKDFIGLLEKGEFKKAESYFSDKMKSAISAKRLEEIWKTLPSQVGNFKGLGEAKSQKVKSSVIIVILGEFERINLDIQLTFNAEGKIQGFYMKPSATSKKDAEKYANPDYANLELFEEKEVTVGTGEFALSGTLSIPKGNGKFPAVILVHGSGPNDRDETHPSNSANKPFKDLAYGLASKGIAVLRYEKRTKQHGKKVAADKNLTVKEESVDDAVLAVELLRKTESVDAKKIYIIGHSLGGYLIPRINKRTNKAAGFISLAGVTQRLEDVILEQNRYFAMLDGKISKAEQTELDKLKKIAEKIKALTKKDLESPNFYHGAYAAYWLDLQNYNPPKEAKKIKKPFLILQGERDYQVTMVDFENWKKALKNKKNVTFKSYPKLNHLFMSGEGKPSPAEYAKTSHVEEKVIEDIASWILKTKK